MDLFSSEAPKPALLNVGYFLSLSPLSQLPSVTAGTVSVSKDSALQVMGLAQKSLYQGAAYLDPSTC